jgi:putative NIF3 family GTP cyclohydrolase 1 type 2
MAQTPLSRRGLLAALTAIPSFAQKPLTAGDLIARIKAQTGLDWREDTVDKLVFGGPETVVRGVATTMMATLEMVQRAAKAGRNLIVTHEPTFYSHLDTTDSLQKDETFQFKAALLTQNNMAVFRFHDYWHARRPDGIATGMTRQLGWEKYASSEGSRMFHLPSGTTLGSLVKEMESKLHAGSVRVIGDPALPVKNVAANWGYASPGPAIPMSARPDVDVLVVGEAREWELVEYVQDMVAAGRKKGLIVLGHVVSEQAGMRYCAEWLRGFVKEVPVEFLGTTEPFWRSR